MSSKRFIIGLVLVMLCIGLGQGLECYEHDFCLGDGCNNVANKTRVCNAGENHCWKLSFATKGTKRGCGDAECKVQVDGNPVIANTCCNTDLCNSAIPLQKATGIVFVFSLIIALIH